MSYYRFNSVTVTHRCFCLFFKRPSCATVQINYPSVQASSPGIIMDAFWISYPFYVLSKLFGQSSFSYGSTDYYKSSVILKIIDQVTSYVAVFANLSILCVGVKINGGAGSMFQTVVGKSAYLLYMQYNCIGLATTILLNWLFRGRILRMMHKLNKCDTLLAAVHLKVDAKYQRRCVVRLMVLVVGLSLLVAIVTAISSIFFYDVQNILVAFGLLVYITLAIHIYVAFIVGNIGAIWFRLRALNCGLYRDFIGGNRQIMNHQGFVQKIIVCVPITKSNEKEQLVQRYANIHHYMCEILKLCNFTFSFQVSMKLFVIFGIFKIFL